MAVKLYRYAIAPFALALLIGGGLPSLSAVETSVPISAETGTSIAGELFPVTVKIAESNLYLSDPQLQFIDSRRIGLRLRLQAYDHRPEKGIAISEMGRAYVSGELDFDPVTRELLLHNPRLDTLDFERQGEVARRLSSDIRTAWAEQVTNPVRSELPPHPYLIPFRNNLQDILYNGKTLTLVMGF